MACVGNTSCVQAQIVGGALRLDAVISPDSLWTVGAYGVVSRGDKPKESFARTGHAERVAPNAWKLAAKGADGAAVTWTITSTNACISERGLAILPWELDTGVHKACCAD